MAARGGGSREALLEQSGRFLGGERGGGRAEADCGGAEQPEQQKRFAEEHDFGGGGPHGRLVVLSVLCENSEGRGLTLREIVLVLVRPSKSLMVMFWIVICVENVRAVVMLLICENEMP